MILTSSKIGPVHSVVFAILGAITKRSHYGRSKRAGRDCQRGSDKEQVMALKSIIDAPITDLRVWSSAAPSLRRKDTCARRVRQRKGCADKALLRSRDDFLFMLYTSGSTTAEYLMWTSLTVKIVFNRFVVLL